jgi:hypothetical protein
MPRRLVCMSVFLTLYIREFVCVRVVQFRVGSKVRIRKISRILTNLINAVCKLLKARRTLSPFLLSLGSKLAAQNAGKSLGWPSNVLTFCALINIY